MRLSARRLTLIAVILILAASAAVRIVGVSRPHVYVFDEVYYAKDAKTILDGRVGPATSYPWEPGKEISWPHPELGKFAIAAGIAVFGNHQFGWRIVPVLAGLALLACVYPAARRMGLPPHWALAALLLAATDPLGIAQSRIATLDIFVGLWTVLSILLGFVYLQGGRRRRWLFASGLAAGLALGTKWSGALAALVVLVLIACDLAAAAARRRWRPVIVTPSSDDDDPPSAEEGVNRRTAGDIALPVLALVVLPAAIYIASYTFYFVSGHTWSQWVELQRQMWHFNLSLKATHSYASAAPTWIFDVRPVWYYFSGRSIYHGIVAMGNPFLWWAAAAALVAMPVAAAIRRRAGLALFAIVPALLYLPWFAASRTSFLYYMTPVAPFLAILVAAAFASLAEPGAVATDRLNAARPEPVVDDTVPLPWRPVALLLGSGVAAFLLWRPVAAACRWVFWTGPRRLGTPVGFVTASLGAAAVLAALLLLSLPRLRPWWRHLSWISVGVIAGIGVIFLPIVINLPISPHDFYHLTWFTSWI